jgi:gas vesicle protein
MQKHSNKFMLGAFIGSTIGAMTTLLFSTAEGKKIQKNIMKKFHSMDHKTGHFGLQKWASPKKIVKKLKKRRK